MNVCITGGAGFIGSHLAERCLHEGWRVSVLDDLSTGSFENIAPLRAWDTFSYRIDSVTAARVVDELVDDADLIFHLAAPVDVRLALKHPIRTMETNVDATEVILRAAAKRKKRVLLASSSEVYGKSVDLPFRENADIVLGSTSSARWGYACSKMLDEFLGLAYFAERGLPITILRFFNTVGPRQTSRYGTVLPAFVRQALLGEPLTVYGSGGQRRCFGYVPDIVEALIRIAGSSETIGEVLNIGSSEEISILELAHLVKEMTGSESKISHIPYEQAYGPGFEDILRCVPSLEKLERMVAYRPSTPIQTIIRSVAFDIRTRLHGSLAA